MKVSELISRLEKMPKDAVVTYEDDDCNQLDIDTVFQSDVIPSQCAHCKCTPAPYVKVLLG